MLTVQIKCPQAYKHPSIHYSEKISRPDLTVRLKSNRLDVAFIYVVLTVGYLSNFTLISNLKSKECLLV